MNIQLKQTFNKLTTHWCQIFLLYFYDTNKKSTTLTGSNYSMIFFVFVAKTEKKVGGKFRLPFFFHLNGLGARENSNKCLNWILWTNWRRGQFFCIIFYDANKKSLYWWSMRCSKRLSSMLDKLMTHWHQFFVIFYDVNKKSPNHSDALLVQSILT